MLVLKRRVGETVCIGDNIKVTILGVGQGAQVRIGFEAPDDIVILREEVAAKSAAKNERKSECQTWKWK